jgi:hypothetical protein
MKRRAVIVLASLLFLFSLSSLGAQNLAPLEEDFEEFFSVIGSDMIPHLQHAATSGQGIGAASIAEDRRFFVTGSAGAVFSDGLQSSVDDGNFEILNVPGLINQLLEDAPSQAVDAYEESLPYPLARAAVGVRLPLNIDLIGMVSGIPSGLTQWGLETAGVEGAGLSAINIGLRGRMPLLQDDGPLPGISLGLGYTYSGFNVSYTLPDDLEQDFSGQTLSLVGDIDLSNAIHTAGVDFTVSKTLAFFVPYLRLSGYYQASTFNGAVKDFNATVGSASYKDQGGNDPEAEATSYDFALKPALGFELNLGGFGLLAEGSYSNVSESFEAHLGLRTQF